MREHRKYFPVNWIDGMKINKNHFIDQDNACTDQFQEMTALHLSPVRYGIVPASASGENTFNVKIALDGIDNSSVKIVDVLGNVVYNESINNGTKNIDVSNFKNGVYFVLVEASGIKSFNRKLIIRH